jgi:hypothetical protein
MIISILLEMCLARVGELFHELLLIEQLMTLLPEGRIFSQITQEAPKNCLWPEKIGGRKIADFS